MMRCLVVAFMAVQMLSYWLNYGARAAPEDTTVYINGTIYTVNKASKDWSLDPKECMVVTGDKIVYLGKLTETIKSKYMKPENKIINLEGRTVLPGMHDVHTHPLEASNVAAGTCILNTKLEPENVIGAMKKCAPKQVGTKWVLGYGHSITKLLGHIKRGGRDPKFILDAVLPNTPCILVEETSHSVWVNSEALRRAGITKDSPDIPGGVTMKNPVTKEPNGILFENAGNVIMDLALKPTPEMDKINYGGLVHFMTNISSYGITSICDARIYWKRGHLKTWNKACDDHKLATRTVLGLWAYPTEDDKSQIAALKNMYSDHNPNCFMKTNQIKFFSDGLIDSTTAALLNKYTLNLHLRGLEANVGLNYFSESRIQKYLQQLQRFENNKGFDIHVHAIGDRGVREVLNAIEATRIDGTRHRITHIELIAFSDIPRFKNLNVIADLQVAGGWAMPSYYLSHLESTIGKTRAENNYILVKKIVDTGARTVFSSDWPVSPLNPFIGLARAVDRGPESVTIKQAIEMYTINAAYVMRQEDVTGSLEVGKAADFVVIDQDIVAIDKRKIKDTVVYHTVLAGEPKFTREGFAGTSAKVTGASAKMTPSVSVLLTVLSFMVMYLK